MTLRFSPFVLASALLLAPTLLVAQEATPLPAPAGSDASAGDPQSPAPASAPVPPPDETRPPRGGVSGFFIDVGRDYRAWFTMDTTRTLMVGTAAAMVVRPADVPLSDRGLSEIEDGLTAGDEYGNLSLQVPLALAWWSIGKATGSRRAASAGRDLLRAQISATSWTYVGKYAVGRTRPNGDPRSFPSGHSSSSFAAATVLQRHYGWKLGVPFYALGVYTAASRIHDRKHWLSDTVMGATVGIAAGRAVTLHVKRRAVHVVPARVAGGVMLQFLVDP